MKHSYNLGFISDEAIKIIEDVVTDNSELAISNTVFDELTKDHGDLLTAIYLLAFSTYEGFAKLLNQ